VAPKRRECCWGVERPIQKAKRANTSALIQQGMLHAGRTANLARMASGKRIGFHHLAMTQAGEMPELAKKASNLQTEHEATVYVREVLASALSDDYRVHQGANLLYRIEIDGAGKISNDGGGPPRRGQYAFQTDILVSKNEIPLVVVELKSGTFSSHDVITYSFKAQRHKQVYPYLRYGFAVVGLEALGRRFVTHNEGFDFAVALPTFPVSKPNWLPSSAVR
jgi:hypothetical protein